MFLRDIYDSALRILAESAGLSDNADYEERAPYLLAAFCNEAQSTDEALRRSLGLSPISELDSTYIDLSEKFPLLPRFSTCAARYLAAMLILDDNREISDILYDKYCDAISSICASISAVKENIIDKYFGNI